jgi:hypothetical protein
MMKPIKLRQLAPCMHIVMYFTVVDIEHVLLLFVCSVVEFILQLYVCMFIDIIDIFCVYLCRYSFCLQMDSFIFML